MTANQLPTYAVFALIGFAAGIIVAGAWIWIRLAAELVRWLA